jgi:hypothetical protein
MPRSTGARDVASARWDRPLCRGHLPAAWVLAPGGDSEAGARVGAVGQDGDASAFTDPDDPVGAGGGQGLAPAWQGLQAAGCSPAPRRARRLARRHRGRYARPLSVGPLLNTVRWPYGVPDMLPKADGGPGRVDGDAVGQRHARRRAVADNSVPGGERTAPVPD